MGKFSLIDELVIAKPGKHYFGFDYDGRELAAAQVFRVDNVDAYFWENIDRYPHLSCFPNVAPPFENLFMFAETTAQKNDVGVPLTNLLPSYRYGVWFGSIPVERATSQEAINLFGSMNTNRLILKKAGVKWFVTALLFEQGRSQAPKAGWAYLNYLVGEDGVMCDEMQWHIHPSTLDYLNETMGLGRDDAGDEAITKGMNQIAVCSLAASLMHCKNVTRLDAPLTKQEQHRQNEYENVARQASCKWKVLNIQPMQRVLREQGNIESAGLVHALHICRGHFKDYRDKGLFGRNKGIYWWDQHMRGDESAGVIIKDYAVQPTAAQ